MLKKKKKKEIGHWQYLRFLFAKGTKSKIHVRAYLPVVRFKTEETKPSSLHIKGVVLSRTELKYHA